MRTVFSGLAAVLLLVNVSFAQEVIFEQGPNCPCPQQACPCPQQCDVCCDPCCEQPLYQPCFDGCCNNCCDCCPCEPVLSPKKSCICDCFYLRLEYLQLDVGEDGDDSRDFIYDASPPNATSVVQNSNQVAHNDEGAIRYTFGVYMGDCGEHLELRYLHTADDWGTSAGHLGGVLADANGTAVIAAGTTSREMEFQTLEANYWGAEKRIGCRLHYQPMIGLRGIGLDELLNINGATFQSDAQNSILGVQYGSELTYEAYRCCNRRFELAAIGKAGVGLNYHEVDYSNVGLAGVQAGRDDDISFAQWAEVGFEGRMHFGRLMISGGYEFLLMNGLDLGGVPADLSTNGTGDTTGTDLSNANDNLWVHGFKVGAQLRF